MVDPRFDVTIADVAAAVRFAKRDSRGRRNNVFLTGAGASITAGIPGAAEIGRVLVRRLIERLEIRHDKGSPPHELYSLLEAQKKLRDCRFPASARSGSAADSEIDWLRVYDQIFKNYYTQPNDVRELFGELVDAAGGAINWAHLVLGELVSLGFASTVLTTNFDQLSLSGIVRAGTIPVVCDGLESLNRITGAPQYPQLIEIHGSRYSYLLRNAPADVESVRLDHSAIAAVNALMQSTHAWIVVGYGGREEGVMDLLVQAAKGFPQKHLYWVLYERNPASLPPKASELLSSTRNGGVLLGYDADRFFLELAKELGVGSPRAINDPLTIVAQYLSDAEKAKIDHPDIRAQIGEASQRLKRFKSAVSVEDPAAAVAREIRELRLKGNLKEAYAAASGAFAVAPLDKIDGRIVEEAAMAAFEYGTIAAEKKPLEDASRQIEYFVGSAKGGEERVRWLLRLAQTNEQLGSRESETERLEKAIQIYSTALKECPRDREPLIWAKAQNGLGNALWTLGERERGTGRLEAAVAAYRAALEERTRERAPLDWAMTLNNLGTALSTLGEREDEPKRLEEAAKAYRLALEEYTRERAPLYWAATLNNLGVTLLTLGERESGTARLEEALKIHRQALEEYTREKVPMDWAMTQSNVGAVLYELGKRDQATVVPLEEAVAAYRLALQERTRERAPLDWAMTLHNLGEALSELGARESGTARLEEAVACFRTAQEEYTRECVPLDWAMTQVSLGDALSELGRREEGTARLEEAVIAYRLALEEYTRERASRNWARAQSGLGYCLTMLGRRKEDPALLEEAVIAYRAALEEFTHEREPLSWARLQKGLGDCLGVLGEREEGTKRLRESVAAYRAALSVANFPDVPANLDRMLELLRIRGDVSAGQ